eukprot:TRINITY_DN28007_c0_g1_i1.p1 TRINITY_DN28007_c0_g1~~TRINITY_DN28007_c0_g1_i1.p1  ORF type:complete len:244 (+),score=45.71 TRINITY_DN28007_c0_g1_i1:135-866(+)
MVLARTVLGGTVLMKRLHFVRHGQALHNINAEAMHAAGCSFQEFLDQMALDDAFDAPLTDTGVSQATAAGDKFGRQGGHLAGVQLVVSSPLSRALDTADLVLPAAPNVRRVALEDLREILGLMENAKRRTSSELSSLYPSWDFSALVEHDELWTEELEEKSLCAHRGFQVLKWVWEREENEILVVGHGGIFKFLFEMHPRVQADSGIRDRFTNCEVRTAILSLCTESSSDEPIFKLTREAIEE